MKSTFKIPIAFGNHCENPVVTYAALAFEPSAVFLYVKGDKTIHHPDENHAISLNVISTFSKNIQQVLTSIGTGVKKDTKNTIKEQK
jgi:sialic acid synthase SpsE